MGLAFNWASAGGGSPTWSRRKMRSAPSWPTTPPWSQEIP